MAGNDKPTVVDFGDDHDVHIDYKTSVAKYERMEKLASDKLTQLNAQKDQLTAQQPTLHQQQADAQKYLTETNNAVTQEQKFLNNLQARKAEADQSNAPASAEDDQRDHEIAQSQARLADYQEKNAEAQHAVQMNQADIDHNTQQLTDLGTQAQTLDSARFSYQNAAEQGRDADTNQNLANVAAGGDPDQIRQAVLAEADHQADKYHQLTGTQADTFEKMNTAQAHLKGMQDELTISQRAQGQLETQLKAAKDAGQDDQAASLQKELDFREGRTADLQGRIAAQEPVVKDLQGQNSTQNDELLAAKERSEQLRGMANGNPDDLQQHFTDRQLQADHDMKFYTPDPDSAEAKTAQQLDDESNGTATPTTGTDSTDNTPGMAPTDVNGSSGTATGTQTEGQSEGQTEGQTPPSTDNQGDASSNGSDATGSDASGTGTVDPGANLDGLDDSGNVTTPDSGTDATGTTGLPPDAETMVAPTGSAADNLDALTPAASSPTPTPYPNTAEASPDPNEIQMPAMDMRTDAAPTIVDPDMIDPTANQPSVDTPVDPNAVGDLTSQGDDGGATPADDTASYNPPSVDTPVGDAPPDISDDGGAGYDDSAATPSYDDSGGDDSGVSVGSSGDDGEI